MLNLKKLLTKLLQCINNNLDSETFTCTPNGSFIVGDNYCFYDKASGLVIINIMYRNDADIGPSTTLYSIPSKYRPKSTVNGVGIIYTSQNLGVASKYTVSTTGLIKQNASNLVRSGTATIVYALK